MPGYIIYGELEKNMKRKGARQKHFLSIGRKNCPGQSKNESQ
jgi:hypothetical protein